MSELTAERLREPEIITTVRAALEAGAPVKQSDVLALIDLAEQLSAQTRERRSYQTSEERRAYYRKYMKIWREKKRAQKAATAASGSNGMQHSS